HHVSDSYHYCGQAIDISPSPIAWAYLYARRAWFVELLGPTWMPHGGLYHHGVPFSDPKLQAQHQGHIHVAFDGAEYPPPGGVAVTTGTSGGSHGPATMPCRRGGQSPCPAGYTQAGVRSGTLQPGPGRGVQPSKGRCLCIRNDIASPPGLGLPGGGSIPNPL